MPDETFNDGAIVVDQAVQQLREIAVAVDDVNAKRLQDLAAALDSANGQLIAERNELAGRPSTDDVTALLAAARLEERGNVARLLDENATSIATFAADAEQLVAMLAFMLRLGVPA